MQISRQPFSKECMIFVLYHHGHLAASSESIAIDGCYDWLRDKYVIPGTYIGDQEVMLIDAIESIHVHVQ